SQTPGSKLILKAWSLTDRAVGARIVGEFAERGIDVSRVDVHGQTAGTTQHLEMYRRIDLALDTFPYNGTTTTCEALWMGVPVVGIEGDSHLSRVGLSLLTAVGMPDMVATSVEQYIALAVKLAAERETLREFSGPALRERIRASTLCDEASFARRLMLLIRHLWKDRCAKPGP